MALQRITSPHMHAAQTTQRVMQLLLLATVPGLIALSWHFGWGSLINIAIASVTALVCEASIVALRKRPVWFYLHDCSALVTAVLIGLALPPLVPWWVVVVGTAFAIIIAKHLYGGMGYNPFNPAMVGYVVLLISFPIEMTTWPVAQSILPEGKVLPGLGESLQIVFQFSGTAIDGYTAATPLDSFKHSSGLLVEQFYDQNVWFVNGRWAGAGWEWVNLGFFAGGCFLLYQRVFTWHAPVAMLTTLTIMAWLNYDGGSSGSHGPATLHLLSGATMLGAFFIVTDPVTSAVSNRGRLIYGALTGILIFVIRAWGNYPDAVAFAVLLMNFAAPFIDYYTLPRTYGHDKRNRGTATLDASKQDTAKKD
ncbi:MAG: electron transport complex subunit RsxD [Gammaproteobacteria bacterium]|nr:MAG: electron transport complex subunit RsxD [Gammaproteobacteria bacterium]